MLVDKPETLTIRSLLQCGLRILSNCTVLRPLPVALVGLWVSGSH